MNGKTEGILEIKQSPSKMTRIGAIGIVATAGCVAVALDVDTGPGGYAGFILYAGAVFFALVSIMAFWRLFALRGAVVTITPEGIRDIRVAAELIPWRAVTGVSTFQYRNSKAVLLAVDPAVESRLTLTRMTRWSRGLNRLLGADGLCIMPTGLEIGFDDLLQACNQYARLRSQSQA
jgi:hypothetical protein